MVIDYKLLDNNVQIGVKQVKTNFRSRFIILISRVWRFVNYLYVHKKQSFHPQNKLFCSKMKYFETYLTNKIKSTIVNDIKKKIKIT